MSKNALFKWRFKLLNAVLNFLSLLRSRNFATSITWRCTSLLYRHFYLRLERTPGWNWWTCLQDAVKLCDVSCKLIWTLSLGFWSAKVLEAYAVKNIVAKRCLLIFCKRFINLDSNRPVHTFRSNKHTQSNVIKNSLFDYNYKYNFYCHIWLLISFLLSYLNLTILQRIKETIALICTRKQRTEGFWKL